MLIAVSLPTISEHPNDMNITVHDSALFKCTAYGFGVTNIVWRRVKYNMPITAEVTEGRSLNHISSILKITEVIGYYSGQYYCIAENECGKVVSRSTSLYVKGNVYNVSSL